MTCKWQLTLVLAASTWLFGLGRFGSAEEPAGGQWGNLKAGRILFLGNSITLHGSAPQIGWTGNWGMAASAREKDYVHVLVSAIAKLSGNRPDVQVDNLADFERHYDTYDLANLKKHLDFKPDIVVVAIGENVPALASEESKAKFKDSFDRLLAALKGSGRPVIFVRSCFWAEKTRDEIMQKACLAAGGVFVDIGGLGKDPSNAARSERSFAHAGVAGHPGDKGMKAIADALLKAMTDRGRE
jgi:lysophospholipase L1-like esterase